ncbi:zinc finger protein 135-like isoform X2 [Esox lucius]|uniref:zinc finger protein 135-like isoform X2 n=1 Tax=Esox lucius TaxID=8010 RepID=UPI0014775FEE|nr:zinc finger protein 135-like isoform X2 [Esox lucius]
MRQSPLPLSSLRLLVPPLRLMSAVMWQVVERRCVEHYGKLEDFVCAVTELVPELLTDRQRASLLLGLRAKISQERIGEHDTPELQTHLDRIQSICLTQSNDEAFEDAKARLLAYTQRLPGDRWAFGQCFNSELESLVCVFLSRLEEMLPVPDFKQAASWLDTVPGGMDECLQSAPNSDGLRSVLRSQMCGRERLGNGDASPAQTNLLSFFPVRLQDMTAYPPTADSDSESDLLPGDAADRERGEEPEAVGVEQADGRRPRATELIGRDRGSGNRFAALSDWGTLGFVVQSQSVMIIPQAGRPSLTGVSQSMPTLALPVACRGQSGVDSLSVQGRPSPEMNTAPVSKLKPHASPENIISESSDRLVECIVVESDTDNPAGESSSSETQPANASHSSRRVAHKCPTCGKCFVYRCQVLRHLATHSRGDHKRSVCADATFDCPQCGKGFASLREQYRHRLTHKTNTCFQCGSSFRTQLELSRHHKTHWAQPLHQCCLCGKRFRLRSSLTNHKQTHSPGGGFACTQCQRVFASAKERAAHRQMHRVPKLTCPVCGETFTSQAKLIKHQQGHAASQGSEGPRYKCRYCEETFTGLTLMRIHQRSHIVDRPHKCGQCEKSFTTLGSLQSHLRTHSEEKPYLCSQCGKRFRTKDGMEGHLRIHKGEKPFRCSYCEKRFTALAGLNVHVRQHTGERPYVCEVCGKAWPSGGDLQKHMRCHTGERPYSCGDCGKAFSISCHLTEHMKTHSGEKPFSCPECGKSLKRKFDLKKHLLTHSEVRPYPCPQCDKSYTRRTHLNRHLQTHSAELLTAPS